MPAACAARRCDPPPSIPNSIAHSSTSAASGDFPAWPPHSGPPAIFSGKNAVAYLRKQLGERDLGDLPLDIAVTNLTTVSSEIRRSGPLAETVMASCAVPALFTIQNFGGQRYLDGGIAAEFPYEHFIDDPTIDTILIHRIRHRKGSQPTVNWETVANAISMSHHASCNELHRLRRGLAAANGKRLVEITTVTPFPGLLSNRLAPTCYDLGRQSGLNLFPDPPNRWKPNYSRSFRTKSSARPSH